MQPPTARVSSYFLPAGRATPEAVRAAAAALPADSPCRQVLEAMPGLACVLNDHRQIVGMNQRFLEFLEAGSREELLGLRPGEALSCIRSSGAPDGCGTTPPCVSCGLAQGIRASTATGTCQSRECRITVSRGEGRISLDFEAVVSPLRANGESYLVCALRDISAEKRRDVLERVFFHDVLNTAGGLAGFADLILDLSPEERDADAQATVARLAHQLVEEIQSQRALTSAERGDLVPSLCEVELPSLLADVAALYRAHEVGAGRPIVVSPGAPLSWTTDPVVLRRILGNLVKNALEATHKGETVTLGACREGARLLCTVHNPGRIPDHVQAQIFQRSFTTKGGTGRGLGTYSVQLYTERVLGGTVEFSSDDRGTTFFVRLPSAKTA